MPEIDLTKAKEFAQRMASMSTGREAFEWLIATALLETAHKKQQAQISIQPEPVKTEARQAVELALK